MKLLGYLMTALLCICFAFVGKLNADVVNFHYVSLEWLTSERLAGFLPLKLTVNACELPVIVVMAGCFVLGALITLLIFGVKVTYWRVRATAVEQQIRDEHEEMERIKVRTAFEASRKV